MPKTNTDYLNPRLFDGWRTLIKKCLEKNLTSNDIKKISGISYRKINDWDEKGLLSSERGSSKSWRKFSIADLIWFTILRDIKTQNIPLTNLKKWRSLLIVSQMIIDFIPPLVYGQKIYLCTDFDNFWGLNNEDELIIPDTMSGKLAIVVPIKRITDELVKKIDLPDFKVIINKDGSYKFIINQIPLGLEDLRRG